MLIRRLHDNNAKLDDTLADIDQPDTPAPVFAARALKAAIFGTPAPAQAHTKNQSHKNRQSLELRNTDAVSGKSSAASEMPISTPSKQPQGILLTPGVGTARRKRVSFGRDVAAVDSGKNTTSDGSASSLATSGHDIPDIRRPRTSLTEKLEKSRQLKPKSQDYEFYTINPKNATKQPQSTQPEDGNWEEVIEDDDDDLDRDRDVTVDLNEPHSRSGRYWKTEYQRYHDEARAEMEKLVKYKQLAKAYAKNKDAEAMRLKERLSEEQARVAEMEAKVGELTRQIAIRVSNSGGSMQEDAEVIRDLAKQTTLAAQYRTQVKELEALVKKGLDKGSSDHADDGQGLRAVSPRTSQTLMETQRQLKRARDQVQELGGLKTEHRKLKTDLRAAEKRAQELDIAKDRVEADLNAANTENKELTAKLALVEERARRKTEALDRLQEDYEKLREESRRTARENRAAIRAKDDEISRLKKLLEKSSDVQISSERASEDLNAPYSTDAPNADWTVNVTQLGDVEGRSEIQRENSNKRQETAQEPGADITNDTSGWTARLEQLDKELKLASPRYEEPKANVVAKVTAVDDALTTDSLHVDKNDFTQRLNMLEQHVYPTDTKPSARDSRAARRDATRATGAEDCRHISTVVEEDSGWTAGESPIRDRLRSRSQSRQRHAASTPPRTTMAARRKSASALAEREGSDDDNFTFDINDDDFTKPLGRSMDNMLNDPEATPRATANGSKRPAASVLDRRASVADLPASKARTRSYESKNNRPSSSSSDEDVNIDLLSNKFARLGAAANSKQPQPMDDSVVDAWKTMNTSMRSTTSTLPPGRHAAAMARLEKRRADRRRRGATQGFDKENVRP
ncbi:uncharacterized protein PgNI_02782 [Pyricularia grisea]|uniref:Spindle pole body-associated protein cut12 domain-containing protein n=1 Tax=Pyricularia grisea TaxID=148305 RepID=A0A6P8B9Q7_PYRGI|nr:uncharacterized protein PgNI_02782 [Pyricularia grisea]TLD12555.1 hypothetical protein PgNI_02782 [Pyricularia grisea]